MMIVLSVECNPKLKLRIDLNGIASLYQPNQDCNDRQYEQDMNEAAQSVGTHYAE
jgi:hypothetical protein